MLLFVVAACRPSGAPGIPAIPGMDGILPFPICLTILAIAFRASISWFTCWTEVPLPAAIRRAGAVDHVRDPPLVRRHREDDRLDARHLLLVHLVEPVELLAHPRDHLQHALERAHLAQHPVALEEVVEGELAVHHAALHVLLLVVLDGRLGALDQRQDVAHAEDPRRHPVGVEPLDLVELLAGRRELDRLPGHGPDGQRRAAARVAVELRQHDAVEAIRSWNASAT